jgi:hypothetical protein
MSQGNKKDKGSAKKSSGLEKFSRKVLGMDRPLTVKEKMKARIKADELYVRLTEPPKGYAMSDKTHTERQRAKSRASSYKRHLQK